MGSSTFRELGINYSMNIERNLALILEKWDVTEFEMLWRLPYEGQKLFMPFSAAAETSDAVIKINGEPVDLVNQASPMEFAAYVMNAIKGRPRKDREAIIEILNAA